MLNGLRELNPWRFSLRRAARDWMTPRLLRHILIVAVTLLLAYNFGRRPSLTYVYLPVVIVALWVIFKNPGLGLVILLGSALVVPFAIGTGTQSALNIAIVGVPLLLGLWLARERIEASPVSCRLR